jgi:nucleoside-diphosphate-sugar epimerase
LNNPSAAPFDLLGQVLVTGATGFIAGHCIAQLLQAGYAVRGTIRSGTDSTDLQRVFEPFMQTSSRLELVTADLTKDEGWREAVEGCRWVIHVASPVPAGLPKDEREVLEPALNGTLRILRVAAIAGVRRTVLTSSLGAIISGHSDYSRVLDESDWSDVQGNITLYAKSKTLAERAAWDIVSDLTGERRMELAVISPGVVFGPLLAGQKTSTSVNIIRKMMSGKYLGSPRYKMAIVDARDVASAHLSAMVAPQAAGKRYCCLAGVLWARQVAETLARQYANDGYRIRVRQLPDWQVRLAALFDEQSRYVIGRLGRDFEVSNQRLTQELGWQPRSPEEAIIATAESLIEQGLVKSL